MRQTLMQLLSWAHSLDQVAARAVERVQILGTGMRSVVGACMKPAAESAQSFGVYTVFADLDYCEALPP